MTDHDQQLAQGFDAQAPKFERAPVQSDPAAIERLVHHADFPPGGRVLDAGCGPGLVSNGLLDAGLHVVGVDLSTEMIERAEGAVPRTLSAPGSCSARSTTQSSIHSRRSMAPCRVSCFTMLSTRSPS